MPIGGVHMVTTVFFALLLVAFLVLNAISLAHNPSNSALLSDVGGMVGLSTAFLSSLSKSNLHVYFFLQRLRIKLQPQAITRWWFAARYDGEYTPEIVAAILGFLKDKSRFKFPVQVDFQNAYELQVEVAKTLVLRISYAGADEIPYGSAHVTVISKTIEVSYGYTQKKLEYQIVPILDALKGFLKPEQSSYELDVEFTGSNPFFAVYINHLRPDQVGDFKVVLRLDAYSASNRPDKVEISKHKLHMTALSSEVFKSLATKFILLSPDIKSLSGVMSA